MESANDLSEEKPGEEQLFSHIDEHVDMKYGSNHIYSETVSTKITGFSKQMVQVSSDLSESPKQENGQPTMVPVVNNLRYSSCKGKQKSDLEDYTKHCTEKIVHYLKEREGATKETQQRCRSIINSTLRRLKDRQNAESTDILLAQHKMNLYQFLRTILSQVGDESFSQIIGNMCDKMEVKQEPNEELVEFVLRTILAEQKQITKN
jgi:hypothetical protein